MLKNLLKFAVSCWLLSSSLFAGIVEDENRIDQISDLATSLDTFKRILQESVAGADVDSLERVQPVVSHIFSAIEFWESNPEDWHCIGWELYPRLAQVYAPLHGLKVELNEQFSQYGFRQGTVDEALNLNFLNAFQHVKPIPFIHEDADPNYISTRVPVRTEEFLNKNHTYVMLEDLQLNALQPILSAFKDPVTECIGAPWRVVNVRAWKTSPGAKEAGPLSWHTDDMSYSVYKIMFYPLGANSDQGGLALRLPQEDLVLEGQAGTWVLFKNSQVLHKGIGPQTGERIAVEITLMGSLDYHLAPISAGQNARHPEMPWQKPYVSKHPIYKKGQITGVNVGGGPNWGCGGWINLEEVTSPGNPHSFLLFPNCHFPIENDAVQTVYTSHAIEHLNLPTVYRVLSESHRVLEKGGNLIIKIPDYDMALDFWRRQDDGFFGSGWNIQSVTYSWASRGTYDCLDYRAAMIFCSFFNDAFGNPFGGAPSPDPENSYFGPPVVDIPYLRELIQDRSPSQITKELRKKIQGNEKNYHFCHQSAWSREELKTMLNAFGFEIVSFDPSEIIRTFETISGIHDMTTMSTFCWAKKRGS